jgi:8-oxo-dGTP diphosphatase
MKVINDNGETMKAGCVVVNDKREVLLVTNKDLNLWIFPKGHAEAGETLEEVALRETLEETGYEVEIVKRLEDVAFKRGQTQTGEPIRVAMFLAKPIKLTNGMPEEEFTWMPIEKAKEIIYPKLASYLDGMI